MRIADVRELTVPIASSIRNAWIDFSEMTCSVVAVVTDQEGSGGPLVGFGFNSNGRYGQGGLLRERFIPRLRRADPEALIDPATGSIDPVRVHAVVMRNEKPGGHGERSVAVGALDMAMWDLAAKAEGVPLARLLARRVGREPATRVRTYAAGGYYDRDKGTAGLRDELAGYLALGYDSVKIKVGGASIDEDVGRVEAAIEVAGSADRVAVDANGRLDVGRAVQLGRALLPFGLMWYEEPVDPLDYDAHARVAESYPGVLATGENLFSVQDVRNLVRYAGLRPTQDVLQMDPVLGYGLTEYLRMLDAIEAAGWARERCVPHGGHLLNLHAAAGLGLGGIEAYPAVFRPFGGFGDGTRIEDGWIDVPSSPGLGLEADSGLAPVLSRVLRD